MPRLVSSIPKYRKHRASGQAIVTLDGRDFYLGPHGTRASRAEYDRLVGIWQQNGRRLPIESCQTTIVELAAAFWKHAKVHYVKHGRPTDEQSAMKVCLRYLRTQYATSACSDFGPLALKSIRQQMVDAGNSRGYINQNISRIKHIFKWGVANELVPVEVYQRLLTVEGLPKGKGHARETAPVLPVEDSVVEATLQCMSKVIGDMVRLQRLTGARPGEVCALRPCDLDRSSDVWIYHPAEHKTEHHEQTRAVMIGPKAQEVLLPYLLRENDAYCFRPKRWRSNKTPRFDTRSYRDAIHRACDKAFPPTGEIAKGPRESAAQWKSRLTSRQLELVAKWQADHRWSPNQIRHTAATDVRRRFGLEAAQVYLGHSKADVTQIYAERDLQLGMKVAAEVG